MIGGYTPSLRKHLFFWFIKESWGDCGCILYKKSWIRWRFIRCCRRNASRCDVGIYHRISTATSKAYQKRCRLKPQAMITLWWTNILPWKDPPCFMGKSTISMAIFHSKLLVHQRVWKVDGLQNDEMMVGSCVEHGGTHPCPCPLVSSNMAWGQPHGVNQPSPVAEWPEFVHRLLEYIMSVIYLYIYIYDVPDVYSILFHYIHLISILSPCWLVTSHYTTMKSLLSDACRVLCLWVFLWLCSLKTCRKIPWTELTS